MLYSIYSKYLGIKFGKDVRILHYPRWGSEPFLIEIGDNVTITRGVSFLNHDGSLALFRNEHPNLNFFDKIIIGSNVFIGINSIIMPGVKIGDNVVIGAGSVVRNHIESNSVYAGVPAKKISDLKSFKSKYLKKSITIVKNKDRKDQILKYINSK